VLSFKAALIGVKTYEEAEEVAKPQDTIFYLIMLKIKRKIFKNYAFLFAYQ